MWGCDFSDACGKGNKKHHGPPIFPMICKEGIQLRTSVPKALTGVGGFHYIQGEYGGTGVQSIFAAYL